MSLNALGLFGGFNIPGTVATCPNAVCPSGDIARDITTLSPNPTLTGNQILNTFVLTSVITAGLAIVVIPFEWEAINLRRQGKWGRLESKRRYWTLSHIQEIIVLLSDQQTTVAIAMLIAVAHQGCTISTYQYNCICYLVIMAVCANLLAILNVKNFFLGRGIIFPIVHISMLGLLLALSGNMIFARGSTTFPVYAGPGQTWPAVCFEKGSYININDIRSGFQDLLGSGQIQFILFLVFIVVALLLLVVEGFKHVGRRPYQWFEKTTLICRMVFSFLTVGVLGYLLYSYLTLRLTMENNPRWYNAGPSNTAWNMSNVLAWAFFAKAMVMALTKINEPYNRKAEKLAQAAEEFDRNNGTGLTTYEPVAGK